MNSQLKPEVGKEDFGHLVSKINHMYDFYMERDHTEKFPFMADLIKISKELNWAEKDPAILSFLENPDHMRGYCCFKAAIISALSIKSVCEIGVGLGISALSFLTANPTIRYVGIENGDNDKVYDFPLTKRAEKEIQKVNPSAQVLVEDSQLMKILPWPCRYDLVYVDGNHSREGCRHDVETAWNSGSEWILVDDTHHPAVAAGFMDAIYICQSTSYFEWTHFPNTWTGNILMRRRH
jgi:predicted O-methyltransferase YrrM